MILFLLPGQAVNDSLTELSLLVAEALTELSLLTEEVEPLSLSLSSFVVVVVVVVGVVVVGVGIDGVVCRWWRRRFACRAQREKTVVNEDKVEHR